VPCNRKVAPGDRDVRLLALPAPRMPPMSRRRGRRGGRPPTPSSIKLQFH